jgi:tetratricopeptide (TPR) repeat protein
MNKTKSFLLYSFVIVGTLASVILIPKSTTASINSSQFGLATPTPSYVPPLWEKYSIALGLLEEHRYEEAIQLFSQLIKDNPNFSSAYIKRSRAYIWLEMYSPAFVDANIAIRLAGPNGEAFLYRAISYNAMGRVDLALVDIAHSLQLEPYNPETYYFRGGVYLSQSNYELALNDFERAIEIDPQYPYTYIGLGELYTHLKKYEEAMLQYSIALSFDTGFESSIYFGRGTLNILVSNYTQALNDFTSSIEIDPNNAEAYRYRGAVLFELDRINAAIQDLTQSIVIDPSYALAYYTRGLIYYDQENYIQALSDLLAYQAIVGDQALEGTTELIQELEILAEKATQEE